MKKALTIAALAIVAFAGAAFAGDKYDLKVSKASGKAGEKATATVTIKPKGDYHVNLDYPHKVTLTAPEGVTVAQAKVSASKVSKEELQFNIEATSAAAGTKTIDAVVKAAVCTESTCEPFSEKVTITVEAQ